MTGPEQVLVEDWCSQYPAPLVGALAFGPDGALYAPPATPRARRSPTTGRRHPGNPCGDPPRPPRLARSRRRPRGRVAPQPGPAHARRPASTLDGTIIRVDPATGDALPGNPLAGSPDPNARRIVAYGLRNPFRIAFRPGTSELWLGDVGWGRWEEIDRIADTGATGVVNFGWPCYEGGAGGAARQPAWDALGLALCEDLYADPAARHGAVRRLPPRRPGRGRVLPRRRAPRCRAWPSRPRAAAPTRPTTTARCSSPTTCATACGR